MPEGGAARHHVRTFAPGLQLRKAPRNRRAAKPTFLVVKIVSDQGIGGAKSVVTRAEVIDPLDTRKSKGRAQSDPSQRSL